MRRAASGFTVIEAVVSLALMSLFMLLAAQLLRDTQLATLATRRAALDPTPQHIAQQLRNDLHRAGGTVRLRGSASALWSRDALTLRLPTGGIVRYEKTADQVSRYLRDAGGSLVGERPLLRGVVSWRWLQLSPDLVEVEVGYRRRPDGDALDRQPGVDRSTIEILRMRVAMRAVPGRRSW